MKHNTENRLTIVRGGQGRTAAEIESSATIVGLALVTPFAALIIVGAIYAFRWVLS